MKTIKSNLLQTILPKNRLPLIILLILGVFFIAPAARAWLDVPFNMAAMQLDSLDFIDNSILRFLVMLVLVVAESTVFLAISSGLLDWASSMPVGLDNGMVNAGWGFLIQFANLTFILIFIFIAFSYILKLETWEMKKALPRLIIIAFLINFSLLFVKMFVDIGWIIQKSFMDVFLEGGSLAGFAMKPLINSGLALTALIASIPLSFMAIATIPIPFVSVGGLLGIGLMVLLGETLFGMISQTIVLIIFNFIIGLIFLVYAILFLIRIGVIWFLAMMAPLAFAAYIMPKTQKYFDQWLKALFHWVFLGVAVFFFMGLGIKLFDIASPGGATLPDGGAVKWNFFGTYYKHIFLLVYLGVTLMFTKKLMPAGTEAVWSLGTMAMNRGMAWTSERTGKWTGKAWEARLGAREEAAKKIEKGERLGFGERLTTGVWTKKKEEAGIIKERAAAQRKSFKEAVVAKEEEKIKKLSKTQLQEELTKETDKKPWLRDSAKIAAIYSRLLDTNAKIAYKIAEKAIADAIKGGLDPDKILMSRPDLAPQVGKTIADVLSKISPEDLRKNIQTEAVGNLDVLTGILLDQAKIDEIAKAGSTQLKAKIVEGIIKSTFDPGDLAKIQKTVNNMATDPRWKF